MLFMSVDYNEGNIKDLDYRGILLEFNNEEVLRAKTDNFIEDYHTIEDYARKYYKGLPLMQSSSIEHYISDSGLDIKWTN